MSRVPEHERKLVKKLVLKGFYGTTIGRKLGMSGSAARYRAKLEGVDAQGYRMGKSREAKAMLAKFDALIAECKALRMMAMRSQKGRKS